MPEMKYVGGGNYVQGVPARDLTAKEWDALPEALQEKAISTGTHKAKAAKKPKSESVGENNG